MTSDSGIQTFKIKEQGNRLQSSQRGQKIYEVTFQLSILLQLDG